MLRPLGIEPTTEYINTYLSSASARANAIRRSNKVNPGVCPGKHLFVEGSGSMLRTILSAVCLFAMVGFVTAEEKKADGKVTTGKFKSLTDGTLTISVVAKKGDEPKDVAFKIGDLKNVTVVAGKDDKKEVLVADGFKELKEGTGVAVTVKDDKVVSISIMAGKKK